MKEYIDEGNKLISNESRETEFPEKDYFSINGASLNERLVLLSYFIDSKQIEEITIISIFDKMLKYGINSLSKAQLKRIHYKIQETYDRRLESVTRLYRFPTKKEYYDIDERLHIGGVLK